MATDSEISSTEQLLALMRKEAPHSPPEKKVAVKGFHGIKSLLNQKVIGIDAGLEVLRIAVSEHSEGSPVLTELHEFPYNGAVRREGPDFSHFLKKKISIVSRRKGKPHIWAAMPSSDVTITHLRIPKVPDKQLVTTIYWSLQKEHPFNEESTLFDFRVLGEVQERGITKLNVLAYIAERNQVEELKELFKKAGLPLEGISIVPFFMENFFTVDTRTNQTAVAHLFVGRDWSRIDIFSKGRLLFTRDIKTGTASIVESLREALHRHSSDSIDFSGSLPSSETLTVESSDTSKIDDTVLATCFLDENAELTPGETVSRSVVLEGAEPVIERLSRQLDRTFEYFRANNDGENINRLFFSGSLCSSSIFLDGINARTDFPAEVMDPLQNAVRTTSNVHIPETLLERQPLLPCVGASISNYNTTINFLNTYAQRERIRSSRFAEKVIAAVSGGAAILLAVILFFQVSALHTAKTDLKRIDSQLKSFTPNILPNTISDQINHIRQKNTQYSEYLKKMDSIAILGKISKDTPKLIKIQSIKIQRLPNTSKNLTGSIIIDGILSGPHTELEIHLTDYLINLENSSLISNTKILRKTTISSDKPDHRVRFTLQADLS